MGKAQFACNKRALSLICFSAILVLISLDVFVFQSIHSYFLPAGPTAEYESADGGQSVASHNSVSSQNSVSSHVSSSLHISSRPSASSVQTSAPPQATHAHPKENAAQPVASFDKAKYDKGIETIKSVVNELTNISPGIEPFTSEDYNRDIKNDTPLERSGDLPPTSEILGMYLQVSNDKVEALKASHKRVVEAVTSHKIEGAFAGRGVVTTGGKKYFPMVLAAIEWLRNVDHDIPVEVFMADKSEYEPKFCEDLFPKLNVECRVLEDIYGSELSGKINSEYAFKPLAILASKFDDIYFMDADSYPLTSVNEIFDWEVYQDKGYILCKDLWPRYISPKYYDVVDIKLGGRVPGTREQDSALLQSDRENAVPGRSTESGQIYVRKSQHIRSLLLSTYYNIYGPGYYFPLIMQGGHGEGDKDTYAAAAVVFKEPYYQNMEGPFMRGHHTPERFVGHAMMQPDPRVDYERNVLGKKDEVKVKNYQLHANGVKSNIKYLMMENREPIRGAHKLQQVRYLQEVGDDGDIELRLFNAMKVVTCDWALKQHYVPRDWEDQDLNRLCNTLIAHTKWLEKNPKATDPSNAPFYYDLDKAGEIPQN